MCWLFGAVASFLAAGAFQPRQARPDQRIVEEEDLQEAGPFPDGPPLIFVEDLVGVLGGLTPGAIRRLILRGTFGPFLRIGRRLALRKASFLASLEAREVRP